MGTPLYMSPEQARGARDVDGRTDIYAASVMFYRALTGVLPYNADTLNELLFKIVLEDPKPLRELAPDVDEVFAAIVHKGLARDLAQRFETAREYQEAIAAWGKTQGRASLVVRGDGSQRTAADAARSTPAATTSPQLAVAATSSQRRGDRCERGHADRVVRGADAANDTADDRTTSRRTRPADCRDRPTAMPGAEPLGHARICRVRFVGVASASAAASCARAAPSHAAEASTSPAGRARRRTAPPTRACAVRRRVPRRRRGEGHHLAGARRSPTSQARRRATCREAPARRSSRNLDPRHRRRGRHRGRCDRRLRTWRSRSRDRRPDRLRSAARLERGPRPPRLRPRRRAPRHLRRRRRRERRRCCECSEPPTTTSASPADTAASATPGASAAARREPTTAAAHVRRATDDGTSREGVPSRSGATTAAPAAAAVAAATPQRQRLQRRRRPPKPAASARKFRTNID